MTTEPASGPASQQPADTLSRVAMPALYILVAISVMQPVALNILAPATPALARTFNTSYATIQLTLSVYLATVALSQLVVGPLSDRYGRRPCVLAGTVLYVIGSLVGALADTVPELLFARALEAANAAFQRSPDFLVSCIVFREQEVFAEGGVKEEAFLGDVAELVAQPFLGKAV